MSPALSFEEKKFYLFFTRKNDRLLGLGYCVCNSNGWMGCLSAGAFINWYMHICIYMYAWMCICICNDMQCVYESTLTVIKITGGQPHNCTKNSCYKSQSLAFLLRPALFWRNYRLLGFFVVFCNCANLTSHAGQSSRGSELRSWAQLVSHCIHMQSSSYNWHSFYSS